MLATVNPKNCQNCALCISACPTGAWASDNFKIIDLLRQAIKQPTWSVACAPSGETADAIVPCLGAVDGVTLATTQAELLTALTTNLDKLTTDLVADLEGCRPDGRAQPGHQGEVIQRPPERQLGFFQVANLLAKA
mgnify:CR=1 FL=1